MKRIHIVSGVRVCRYRWLDRIILLTHSKISSIFFFVDHNFACQLSIAPTMWLYYEYDVSVEFVAGCVLKLGARLQLFFFEDRVESIVGSTLLTLSAVYTFTNTVISSTCNYNFIPASLLVLFIFCFIVRHHHAIPKIFFRLVCNGGIWQAFMNTSSNAARVLRNLWFSLLINV